MKSKVLSYVLVALVCIAAGAAAGWYFEHGRSVKEATAAAELHRAQLTTLRGEATQWAETLAGRQAEAVLWSFVSGITPSILTGRRESIEISAVSLLRIPGVEGIHVLRPDAAVDYSSDAKLATTGEGGEKAAWATAATELISRPSPQPGSLDLAAPVIDAGKILAIVWLEFGLESVRDFGMPAGLAAIEPQRN
ncbi:MAG: hypothetical protein CVU69_07215 [Deltaproteobacteria bacterium HGW-Deltaproteobacteria-4]|nr:MAG: hypothetical protein CVU69_07215 [Deltaproteobacteria bacterium HGW-Deltaproteobacteria-4]